MDSANPEFIKTFKFDDAFPEVECSQLIKADFHVEAYKGHMKIVTRDLVNTFSSIQFNSIFSQHNISKHIYTKIG